MNVNTADDTAPAALPRVGEILDRRFEIRALLGEGGMGHVFRVLDHRIGREVALKLIVPRYLGRPEREQRFLRELELGQRADRDPHLVEIIDGGRLSTGWPFLVMELVEGRALANRLARGPLRAHVAARMARQIAGAVRALHRCGVVHRDITPMNVVTLRNDAVLIDLSHAGDAAAPPLPIGHPGRLTRDHEVPGSHHYMPPEQARSDPAQPAMDVYAFGVMLADMLTGLSADNFSREVFIELQREGKIKPPRIDIRVHTKVPRGLADLVEACTALDPAARPTMVEVVQRLDHALATMVIPADSSATAMPAGRIVAEPVRVTEPMRGLARARTVISPPPPLDSEETPVGGVPISRIEHRAPPLWGRRIVAVAVVVAAVLVGAIVWWWSTRPASIGVEAVDRSSGDEAESDTAPRLGPVPETAPRREPQPANKATPAPEDLRSTEPVAQPAPPSPAVVVPTKPTEQRRGKPKAVAKPQAPCGDVAAEATAASQAMRWDRVLALTKSPRCWDDGAKRVWLRVEALSELGRFAECVRVGSGSSQPVVQRTVKHCARQLESKGTP